MAKKTARTKTTPAKARARKRSAKSPATRATTLTCSTARQLAATNARELAHHLHTLLHTMHAIQHHEEKLCSLAHALKHGRASTTLLRDLRDTLQDLPADDYLHEVQTLRDAAGLR